MDVRVCSEADLPAAARFALTWTGRHNARPPQGVRTIRSRYRRLWVIGRTLNLRIYGPARSVLTGAREPPPVEPVP